MVQYQEIKESTKLNIQRLSYLITDITEPREKLKKETDIYLRRQCNVYKRVMGQLINEGCKLKRLQRSQTLL